MRPTARYFVQPIDLYIHWRIQDLKCGGGGVAQNLTSLKKRRLASSLSEGWGLSFGGGGGAQAKSNQQKRNDRGEVYFRGAYAPYAPWIRH